MVETSNTIISIGLPVYNGEEYLCKKIESILNQTLENFELIISDNASTDQTREICQKFVKKDPRIRYFRQDENIGSVKNFEFVLKQARSEYYIATAVDDQMSNNYLEKNLEIIKNTKNCIGSVGKTNYFGPSIEELEIFPDDSFAIKIEKQIRQWLASFFIDSYQGTYYEKIRMALKWSGAGLFLYGVFKTEIFKKSFPTEKIFGLEHIFLLNLIKYGDIVLNNNTSMEKFVGKGATSASGMFSLLKNYETNFFTTIFPMLPFTVWVLKKYGIKIFLRNLDGILEWNLKMELFTGYSILKKLKKN